MWGLWLFPLVVMIFLGALIAAIAFGIIARPKRWSIRIALLAAPFGCAVLPIAALIFLGAAAAVFQKSDAQLFQEIYGFIPEMNESQMLSDDFGIWSDRAIYMRLEPTPHDRKRILDVAPKRSDLSPEQFAALGNEQDFMWWDTECKNPAIYDASGYREWRDLTVYDCPEQQRMFIIAFRP